IEDIIGLDASDALEISAKTGLGVADVLEAIVHKLPAPSGDAEAPLQALIVDSWYDAYLGVVTLIRVRHGRIRKGSRLLMMGTRAAHQVDRVGVFTPKPLLVDELGPGEVGFITASVKDIADTRVGDTVTEEKRPADKPLPGFRPSQPVVFCGMFPADASDYDTLRDALGKLRLNDASFEYEPESSSALGLGFRCGFLGLLHLEIIQERLDREFDLDLVLTAPSVVYRMHLNRGETIELHNPADYPDPTQIQALEEPWIKATILVPDEFLGKVLDLCTEKRGVQQELTYVGQRAMLVYRLPLNEVVYDFYDRLKSATRGYASFDYQLDGYGESDLVKLSVLV
ncbi:MAG: elongation factor 4, partial [Geminicoccaceae bacterium]|nr:elongation factor 4 [Geminicoccaceae bacterium]